MMKTLAPSPPSARLVLAVRVGRYTYGISLESVEVVLPALPIEPVPQCPHFMLGVVFVRGQLIPVINAAQRLGFVNHQSPLEPHIICLRIDNRLIGLQVDEALDLVNIERTKKLTADELGTPRGFFFGVADLNGDVIRLLDVDQLLAADETQAIAKADLSKRPE